MFELLPAPEDDHLDVELENDGYVISVPFAECSETWKVVSLDVFLKSRLGEPCGEVPPMEYHEATFVVSVTSDFGVGPVFSTMDRELAKPFIPEEGRASVGPIVASCFKKLVDHVKPTYLLCVTYAPNLPERGLTRYRTLVSHLEGCGYEVSHEGTDWFDRRFWLMGRKPG